MGSQLVVLNRNGKITNWSPEAGYAQQTPQEVYPRRVFNARRGAALTFSPQLFEQDLEYVCRDSVQGFDIFLHVPGETIQMSRQSIRVPLLEETDIAVKPTLTKTSEKLKKFTPKQRQCFFDSERKLAFFVTYSEKKCEVECLANFTKSECGCVKYSMPS